MSEMVTCPSCSRPLRVPDDLLGQQVKCPVCNTAFLAELSGPAPLPPRPEPSPGPARGPRSERVASRFDEDDRPRRLAARREDEDRPRRSLSRRRDEDEEDEDRPRRSRRYLQPHRGGAILAMGILSFFMMPLILGPVAWIMGTTDLREMRAGRMDPEGMSQTNTGRICGMIVTILWTVLFLGGCVLFAILFMIGVLGSAAGASQAPAPPPRRF